MRFNIRKPQGIDAVIEHFLGATGDVLVDLPAGGSDMTARLCSAGSAEGTLDIRTLFPEVNARLLIVFVIDPSRDALVALDAEIKALSNPVTDWVVVRNHRFEDTPFDRFDKWADGKLEGVPVLDMPRLDPRVIDALINAKANLTELGGLESASALMKMRGAAALRVWTGELRKGKVLDG